MSTDYDLSQQLFLDLWAEYRNTAEITEREKIVAFLGELIRRSNGLVILEHFLGFWFHCVQKVNKVGDLAQLVRHDFDTYRQKQIAGTLDENEKFMWSLWDNIVDEYFIINISKLAFRKVCDHLFILLYSNPISQETQKFMQGKRTGKCVSKASEPYRKYAFSEDSGDDVKKHVAYVSNLPFFCCLLQPKECAVSARFSSQLMYMATQTEIDNQLSAVEKSLTGTADDDSEKLRLQGLIIRKMLEGELMYRCAYKNIRLHYSQKSRYMRLDDLIKALMKAGPYVILNNRLIDMDALLDDTDTSFTKEQLCLFLRDAKETIEQVRRIPLVF